MRHCLCTGCARKITVGLDMNGGKFYGICENCKVLIPLIVTHDGKLDSRIVIH